MYLKYYQLAQKPFQINTDPAFLWFGEKHKEALATLKYGILENKSFLLLTGDVGVGKTTIINALLQVLDENDLVAVINDPKLDNLDFFLHIARGFGLSGNLTTKGRFLISFWKFLLAQHYQGKRVLLIVDEAQLLSHELLEEIRLFSNLEKDGTKLINIFFVGQLELNDILLLPENKAIRQRITVNYNIPPLSLEETEQYIEYRLAVAGANQKIFEKSAIREIFHFSNGYPRLINVLSDRALLTGFIRSTRHIPKKIIQECAQELDISLANKSTPHSNKEENHQDEKATPSNYPPFRYISYAVIVSVLLFLIYLFSTASLPTLTPDFSKIQALMPGVINKKQDVTIPEPLPAHLPPVVVPEPPPQPPPPVVVPEPQPEPPPPVVVPEPPPQPPPVGISSEQGMTPVDYTANHTASPAGQDLVSLDTERPLELLIISFESDSLDISAPSLAELEKLVEAVLRRKTARILVRGYTDSSGSTLYNKKLARFRATSVKNILVGKGISQDKISIVSHEDATIDTAQDQGTRRVEVEVLND